LTYSEEGSEEWDRQRALQGIHLHNLIARKKRKVTNEKQKGNYWERGQMEKKM